MPNLTEVTRDIFWSAFLFFFGWLSVLTIVVASLAWKAAHGG